MGYRDRRVEIADGVAVLTLDRPAERNAFSGPMGTALAMARDIATNCAPLSVALSKRLLWESRGLDRDEIGRRETAYHHLVMGQPDALEGVLAFLERRPPRWALAVPRDWPPDVE